MMELWGNGTEQHEYIFRRYLVWWVFVQCYSKKVSCTFCNTAYLFGLVVSHWISWFFRAGGNQNFVQKHSPSKCKQCSPVFEEVNKFCQFQLVPKLLNSSIQVPGVLPLQYFAPLPAPVVAPPVEPLSTTGSSSNPSLVDSGDRDLWSGWPTPWHVRHALTSMKTWGVLMLLCMHDH